MAHRFFSLLTFLVLPMLTAYCQPLKAGFSKTEYEGVLRRSVRQVDSSFRGSVPDERQFVRVYRSPQQGMYNKFDIWLSADKTTIAVNLRGTTSDAGSWIENLYSAMIPATGSLKLSDTYTFNYKFASDPRAAVHAGWATGIASIAPDVVDKVRRFYAVGAKQLIVEGHSQGGALSYLLTSYLHYLRAVDSLPRDLVIKTYCSAAPKPGNLYYAYDFDHITMGGWAFNVVNAADWVPETPMSIQTLDDMNPVNPFSNPYELLRKQNLATRWYVGRMYRRLNRAAYRSQHRFERTLGRKMHRQVRKFIPDYTQPEYAGTCNYMRAGTAIVLQPDEAYYKKYPRETKNIFLHHLFESYYYLAARLPSTDAAPDVFLRR